MSIYAKFHRSQRQRSDVHATETVQQATISPPVSPPAASREDGARKDGKHLRRAEPASTLVPSTWKWVEGLPPNVRPSALLRQYPRIANLIAVAWGDKESFDTYTESLLTDKRGNRRGFPPEVLKELMALRDYYDIAKKDTSVWHTVGKRG